MNDLKNILTGLLGMSKRMSASQALLLLGVTVGGIVGAIALFSFIGSINYTVLYSNLDQSSASEVVKYLDGASVPYEISAGGRTISVPDDVVHKTRMTLASQGLPNGGIVGYSIFDETSLGMTEFLQHVNYKRALEGELTRSIMEIKQVQAARVHIVMPRDRLFTRDKRDPTASVLLKLSSGELSRNQIAGIRRLVASSVEGMRPSNIAIIDYFGNLLTTDNDDDPVAGLSSSQLQVRKDVEAYLEKKAQSMLDDVIGKGNSVVRITADLDFQRVERTDETYDPNLAVIRSEERSEETKSSSDKSEETSESTEDGKIERIITNYEIPRTVEHIVNAVGVINRISVALVLDGVYEDIEDADGNIIQDYSPRSQEEIDRLSAVVRSAIGFDADRNDQIEVYNVAFDRENLEYDRVALDSVYDQQFYLMMGKKIGFWALILFAALYFMKKTKKLFAALGKLIPPPAPQAVVDLPPIETPLSQPPLRQQAKVIDQMQGVAEERPDEIAKVIKTMMFTAEDS
ncbi:MAG: flagellar M-ring protein FliF [candidate division Zixibacteria bacterium]|nr:flagellar M-ring protein FliF [candidate division Zixibacteria bacterium]